MSTLSVRLPESLHRQLRAVAKREGVSINQLVLMAVTKQVTGMRLAEFVAARGGAASPEELLRLLDEGGDEPPVPGDELPASC